MSLDWPPKKRPDCPPPNLKKVLSMAAERGEIPNTLTFLIPGGGAVWDFNIFWKSVTYWPTQHNKFRGGPVKKITLYNIIILRCREVSKCDNGEGVSAALRLCKPKVFVPVSPLAVVPSFLIIDLAKILRPDSQLQQSPKIVSLHFLQCKRLDRKIGIGMITFNPILYSSFLDWTNLFISMV